MVQHVVDGYSAEESTLLVADRNGQEVVARKLSRDFGFREAGIDVLGVSVDAAANFGAWWFAQHPLNANGS